MVCYAYNPGDSWSKVAAFVNEDKFKYTAESIRKNVCSKGKRELGLERRRADEKNLLLNRRYEYHDVVLD